MDKAEQRRLLGDRTLRGDRNQCTCCGQLFNSTTAFDWHRNAGKNKQRRCLTSEELIAKGGAVNGAGFWITRPFKNGHGTVTAMRGGV